MSIAQSVGGLLVSVCPSFCFVTPALSLIWRGAKRRPSQPHQGERASTRVSGVSAHPRPRGGLRWSAHPVHTERLRIRAWRASEDWLSGGLGGQRARGQPTSLRQLRGDG